MNNHNEILATIAQGTLSGTEEEGMMTFYRIPYGTNAGRFREVGAAPTWEGIRDASKPGSVFPQNKSRLSSVLGNKPGERNQSEDAFHVNVWTPSLTGSRAVLFWIPFYRVGVKLAGMKVFEKPTEHLLNAMKETGSKVYLYCFAWQSPNQRLGAPHCIDLPFIFGNLDDWADAPMLEGADAGELRLLSGRLQSAVLRFVKNGNPSSEEETWPEYCGDKDMTVIA